MSNINKNQDSFKDIKKAIRKAINPLRKYVKENLVSIKAPNGVVIIIDKGSINNFIMSDDEVSKIVEELKREIVVKPNSEIEYIKKNFNKLSVEGLNNIIESNKEGINKNNMSDFIMNNNNVSKVVEKLNRKPINKNSKYVSACEVVSEN